MIPAVFKYIKGILAFFLSIFFIGNLSAQSNSDITGQIWISFSLNKQFAENYLFYTNPEYYYEFRADREWNTYAWSNGLEYYPSRNFDLFLNVYAALTEQTSGINTTEVRPVLGGRWNIIDASHRARLTFQAKYEFRNFYESSKKNWSQSNRLRVQLQTRYSLNRETTVEDKNFIIRVYAEEFMNIDENIEEAFWNNRRFAMGFYYRHTSKKTYELRYQLLNSKNTLEQERFQVRSHILYVLFTFYL